MTSCDISSVKASNDLFILWNSQIVRDEKGNEINTGNEIQYKKEKKEKGGKES